MISALDLTSRLLAFAFFLQGLEYFLLLRKEVFFKVWSSRVFKVTIIIHLIASMTALVFPQPFSFIVLFITQLLTCIRFKGTFNGGSDMMGFVVLTGVLVGYLGTTENIQKLGLIYISIHLVYSYFKAGLAKIIHKEWRDGTALSEFLKMSLYADIQKFKVSQLSGRILCLSVLAFELGILLIFAWPELLVLYFVTSVVFHLCIFFCFGLNRFFWIWLSAWPSLFYFLPLINFNPS